MDDTHNPESNMDALAEKYLQPSRIRGQGELRNKQEVRPVHFCFVEYPEGMEFVLEDPTTEVKLAVFSDNIIDSWSISGTLSDGRLILCDNAFPRSLGTFVVSRSVQIGNKPNSTPQEVSYWLVGFYEGKIDLQSNTWHIESFPQKQLPDLAKHIQQGWGITAEGLQITLSCDGAKLEDYELKIRQITDLLSLACGTGITYHRSKAFWPDGASLETIGRGARDNIGPGKLIACSDISIFLETALTKWGSWPDDMQNACRLIIDYICSTGRGYLDTRLLMAWQAWEIAASNWGTPTALSAEEISLKTLIQSTYKGWRQSCPDHDPNGHLYNRLSSSFQWPAALRQLEALADRYGIDREKFELDFKELKRVRDFVVHNGKLPDDMNADTSRPYHIMQSALFGLQLLMLVKLGYNGLVAWHNQGWRTYSPIQDFLK